MYQITREGEVINRQTDAAWDINKQIDAAKQRVYNKFTQKEIAENEKAHAEQVKRNDAQYTAELKEFAKEHINSERSKEHQKQINEIKLKHNDELLSATYENYKDVARKPQEGKNVKEDGSSRDVPKRAVYIGRGEPRQ